MGQFLDSDEHAQRVFRAFPFERVEVPGAQAWEEWSRLRSLDRGWPIIVGGDEDFLRVAESVVGYPGDPNPVVPVERILHQASELEHPASLRRSLRAAYLEYGADAPEADVGGWPDVLPQGAGLSVPFDILSGKPFDKVHIVVLPTRDGTEAPAYLRWGGWNECPAPDYQVAALRSWRDRYGVELVAMSGDVLNLKASRRPATRDEAINLAQEQFEFCTDIVEQGVGTVSNLAALLMADDWWYFWWD